MTDRFVFAIDGGGIRGIIPAVVLAEIERRLGRPISDVADVLAGTSTGGLLAVGLSKTAESGAPFKTAAELKNLYIDRGPEIFAQTIGRSVSSVGGYFGEKYSARGLVRAARDVVRRKTLVDLASNLFVTSYDTEKRKPIYLGTEKVRQVDRVEPGNFSLVDVIRATSAAPTYFEPLFTHPIGNEETEYSLIDGGVFANNPATLAYVFARELYPDDPIHVVSFGTGITERPLNYDDAKDWGKVEWAQPVLAVMMDGVADAVGDQLQTMLGDKYWRFDIHLKNIDDDNPAPSDDMDDVSRDNLQKLKKRGEYLVQQDLNRLDALVKRLPQRN